MSLGFTMRADRPVTQSASALRYLPLRHSGILDRMTDTITEPNATLCACGCGGTLSASNKSGYKRGHYLKNGNGKLTVLPSPDEDLDAGEALPDGAELADYEDFPEWLNGPQSEPEPEPEQIRDDPPPARLRAADGRARTTKRTRVTVGVQKDVQAKIRMVLVPLGTMVLAPRDPICGGTFVQQEPEISEALAEIICDSPDLLNWFTGPAGGYMKYFKLFMACLPVGMAVVGHHMAHSIQIPADPNQPQQQPQYAA